MNPWEILGLKEGASDKQIKKAFRDLAKKHHPDKGGDGGIFAEISKAFALIETEDARKKFERSTGLPEKSLTSMAIEVVLIKIMGGIQTSNDIMHLKHKQLIEITKEACRNDLTQMKRDHRKKRLQIEVMQDLISRFTFNGEKEKDFISYALDDEVNATKKNLKRLEKQMQIAARGLTLLKKYSFNAEVYMANRSYHFHYNPTSFTTAGD